MSSTWVVLLLCIVGVLSLELEHFGKLPVTPRTRTSLEIFNGKNTSVAKYPYIASLLQNGEEFGAAVILNKRWLLTAAYTVLGVSLNTLGFRVGSDYFDKQGQALKASKVVFHPNYTGVWDYDIAVVKTDKPIKLGKYVKPVKLGTKKLAAGMKAKVAGWGEYDATGESSENLRAGEVTVYDWKKCKKIYTEYLTPRIFCTFDKKVAPCDGDFGDPLEVNGVLYGLFAGGFGCAPGLKPILFADVPSYYKWVQAAIKGDEDDQE